MRVENANAPDSECGVLARPIRRVDGGNVSLPRSDFLAVEEPLEIQLGYEKRGWRVHKSISVTMRTPGQDEELAAGFLFTEGIVADAAANRGSMPGRA